MDLDNLDKQAKKADNLLGTLTDIIKKRWPILIVLAVCGFVYWALGLPDEPADHYDEAMHEQFEAEAAFIQEGDEYFTDDSTAYYNNTIDDEN